MAFDRPRKAILTAAHLAKFQGSNTYEHVVAYITELNDAVIGVKTTDTCSQSGVCSSVWRWSLCVDS